MEPLRRSYLVEQTAAHLREKLRGIKPGAKLPGLVRLATQLGVSKSTLRGAVRMLETDGLVVMSEDGFSRLVNRQNTRTKRPLRIGILLFAALANESSRTHQMVVEIQHQLEHAGFICFISGVDQCGLHHDVDRISRYIRKTEADAWVVISGSRELLGWLAEHQVPCIAFAGRRRTLPLAAVGADVMPAFINATRILIGLGHRRIVFLCHKPLRLPEPGHSVNAFLKELADHGIPASDYNLPDWVETADGLNTLLTSLFRITPPTALIIDDVLLVTGILQFLGRRKLVIPDQISLVLTDDDPSFAWCVPPIACIRWDGAPIVRRIVRWATALSLGRQDIRQVLYPAEFIAGGTIGTAPKT
jgi:DNA-binding LacI/PurR family transcriptional regulator